MAKLTVVFKLIGTRPLLTHSTRGMKPAESGIGKKQIPSPAEEAELGLYYNNEKQYCFPVIGVRNAALGASKTNRMKFGKASAYPILAASVFPAEEFTPILDPESAKPLTTYQIDVRPAVIQGKRVMRARPRFDKWMLRVAFELDDTATGSMKRLGDALLTVLRMAGQTIGIGDYRPQKGGMFGLFTVELETKIE
jgi:hypothetical protein